MLSSTVAKFVFNISFGIRNKNLKTVGDMNKNT